MVLHEAAWYAWRLRLLPPFGLKLKPVVDRRARVPSTARSNRWRRDSASFEPAECVTTPQLRDQLAE